MKTKKIHFRSSSRAVALEPRLLFDGAGAVAAADAITDFDYSNESQDDGLVQDVHESSITQTSVTADGAIEIIEGDDSLHIPSSLGSRLGLDAEQENILAGTEDKSLLIIDSRVDNYELLLESVGSSVTVVVVGEGESGLDAINNALAGSSGYDAIHIISHGTPGSFTLGTDQVDSTTIQHNSAQLQGWAEHLNAGADILLYGCDVAQGETGQSFVAELAAITGADIAASINPTGNAEHGGDWVLESATGPIEAGVLAVHGFEGLLADASFKDTQPANSPREVMEDNSFTLSNFTVSGADSLTVTITLSEDGKTPASGKFSLSTTNGLTFTTGNGSSATTMTFSGTATDINNALASLKYAPTANFNGEAKLAVVSGSSNKDIVINVIPDNDAPNFAPPPVGHVDVARADEEGSGKLVVLTPKNFGIDATNTTKLGLFDPDLDPALSTVTHQTAEQIVFEVTGTPANGRLVFGDGNTPLLAGSLFSLQDLIDGKVKYQHDDSKEAREGKTAGSEKDSFALTVRDGAGGEGTGTVHIKINPVNDAPSISGEVSGGVVAYEGRNGVPISVSVADVDQLNENGSWTFTFSDLSLTGSGTTLYLDNNGDGKYSAGTDTQISNGSTFTGTQAELNAKLKLDISDDEPTAPISFKVSVTDDGGGEGVGATKTSAATITIAPRENNDHPILATNTAPDLGSAHFPGTNIHTIAGADLKTLLGVTDVDSPKDTLTYTLVTNVIAESGSSGTVYLLKEGKYLVSGGSFTQAELEANKISIVFTGGGENTSHFNFQVRDGELTAFSTVKQQVWASPSAIEGGTRDSADDNYLTHSFYVRFNTATGDGGSYSLEPANQAPVVGTIVGITANELNESGTTLLYGGTDVGTGKPGIVITDNDNADNEITIRLEKTPTGGHIELETVKGSGNWQTVPIFGSFTYAQLNNGQVRYVHDGGEQFLSSNLGFAFSVSDGSAAVTPPIGGESGNGNNFTVEATPVNDTPEVSISGNPMVLEGDTLTFNTSGNPAITLSDVDGSGDAAPGSLDNWANSTAENDELYVTVNFTSGEGTGHLNGKLYNGSTEIANGATVLKSDIDAGKLKYVHDGSENHSGKFTLTVNDAQGKGNTDGHATSVGNTLEVNIEVAPVNDIPIIDQWTNNDDTGRDARPTDEVNGQQAYNTGLQVYEGGSGVIAGNSTSVAGVGTAFTGTTDSENSSQLVSIDPDNTDTQIQYKILTNTAHGKLSLNGKVLGAGSTFTQANLNNGLVKYTHDASESKGEGKITDTFQFQVGDSGPGIYPWGWFDIEILPANDRPTVEAPSSQPIIVDTQNGSGVSVKGDGGKPFSVDDVDSVEGAGTKDFLQVTVRLLDENGDPVTDYSNVTFGYASQSGDYWAEIKNGNASILQFQGRMTQVNAALAGLTVKFTNDRDARYQIEVIVDDRARKSNGSLKTTDYANGGKYNEPTTPGGPSGNICTTEFDWATNIKVPTSTSADGYGNINSSTVVIWASNENDAPVVTVPGSAVVVDEDVRTQISGITYTDPDAFDSTDNTLTLSVSNGTLWFSANESDKSVPGGATVSGGEVGSNTVTLKGSKAQLDAALAQLRYQGVLDFNGTDQLTVIVNDGGNYGQDGTDTSGGGSNTGTVDIHILPVNDAPTLTLPNENSYLQVTGGSFVLSDSSNPIVIADDKDFSNSGKKDQQDGVDNFTVTLTLSGTGTKLGSITLTTPGTTITDGSNGTASVTLTGSRADINAALAAGVTYSDGGQNIDGTVKLTVTVNDNANGGTALTDPQSGKAGIGDPEIVSKILYLQPTDANDAPSFTKLDNSPTYVQNSNKPVVLDGDATLVDPELDLFGANGNWNGAELTLQRDGGASSYDIFGFTGSGNAGVNVNGSDLRIGTAKVGTVTNTDGVLTISFSNNPTAAQVDQVLQAITYRNTDPAPDAKVQINYSIRDGNSNTKPTASNPVGPDGKGQDQGTGGELTGTGSITVNINRQVIAEPDSNTITEGGATTDPTTITGDITPGTTNSNDNNGSQDRDPDADQTIVVQGVKAGGTEDDKGIGTNGIPNGNVGSEVQGQYGKIVINADGSYTYTLDNTNLAVQALVPGETLADVFSYAINDNQGANSTTAFSTLTITINGSNDGVTVDVPNTTTQTTPDQNKTDHVVFESGLSNGSSPNANDTIVESSFTILALDGLDSTAAVVIAYNDGNNKTETISKTELEALSSSNTKTFTTQYGDLVLNGYSKTSDGTITVNYTYTLTQAPTVNGVDTNDSFTITAKDRNGDSDGPQTLNIKIVDDAPTAVNDTDSVRSGESKTGNVLSNDTAGADDWKKDASSNVAAVVDVINSSSTPATPDSNGNLVVSGTYGTLTLQPDGSYTYQANPDVIGTPTDVFTYTVEDADGDQTAATLTITINNSDLALAPGTANVYEKHLADGTEPQAGGAVVTDNLPLTSTDTGGHTLTNPALVGDNGGASKGTVVINDDGTYTYTLTNTENHSGTDPVTDTFTYTAKDEFGNTVTNTVTIIIVDDAPEAVNDTVNLGNKLTISGNALQGDDNGVGTDKLGADGAKVTGLAKGNTTGTAITDDTGVAGTGIVGDYGTLILNADGSYTYTRTDTTVTSATDVFTYTITDADGDTSTATITINIDNKAPNTPTGPGVDTTTPPNEVDEAGLSEGSNPGVGNKVTGEITFTSGDGEHKYTITTPPGFGEVVIKGSKDNNDGTTTIEYEYTLTTPTDKSGDSEDKFTVTITDEDGDKVDAEVTIKIKNDKPTATDDNDTVVQGKTTTGNVTNNDKPGADGWPVSGGILTGITGGTVTSNTEGWIVETTNGTLTIKTDGSYTYEAKPGSGGNKDTFTYTVTDKDGDTATAELIIDISSNTPPVAKPDTNVVPEDTPATGNILTNDSDPENDPLEVQDFTVNGKTYPPGSTVEIPGVGEIIIGQNGDYSFTPVPDWNGKVPTIDYTVTDGKGGTATSTLDIEVTPVKDIEDDSVSTKVDKPITFDPRDNDDFEDGDAKITGHTPPANGTVTITPDGTITYTPNPGFIGEDTFEYTVTSGGKTETGTITVKVENQPPVANPDTNVVPEDTPATGNILTNDSDPDGHPVEVQDFTVGGKTYPPGSTVQIPSVGEITIGTNGDYTFTPVPDWNGKVPTIDYTVTDGKGGTATSTLDIEVTPVKDIEDDSVSTKVDKPITFDPRDNDDFEDGDAKITGHTPPANGTVTITPDGTITYTPNPGFIGEDTFEYTVTSGGVTETGTITVKVENQPPVANPDTNVVPEDTPATGNILTNDGDPEGHPIEVQDFTVNGKTYLPGSTVEIPGVGEITIGQNGDYSFTPVPDWNGKVPTIDYTVTDGKGGTASSTLDITITPVQDIQDDTTSTPSGNPVNVPVLDNDRFSDPNAKVTGTTPPANGKVTINPDGTITYTPNPGFSGEDTFTYTVTTEGGVTETGTVTIVVHPENPPAPTPVPPTDNYQPPGSVGTDKGKDPVTGSPVITDPSVFYEGERWNDVRRLPIPLHPVLYVNNQVEDSQLEREQADLHTTSSPELTRSYRMSAKSIGNGLGQDHNLFVSHAIRAAQGTASDLEDRVNSRLSRINLSADDLLSAPELRQADPDNMVADVLPEQPRWISQPVVDAEEIDSDKLDGELVTQSVPAGAAPSFTEQLRGGDKRLPMAALNKNFLIN